MFKALYEKMLQWSKHPKSVWFLGGLSFAESSFFPIPPDVMLAPMCISTPQKAWYYALVTTICSVIGGMLGYSIGFFSFDIIQPYIQESHYWQGYLTSVKWFEQWGFWAILLAGFSPIPYKIFTITAGALSMMFIPFVVASVIGRGCRFFLVAGLMFLGGDRMNDLLKVYIDRIGWGVIVIFIIIYFVKTF